MTNYQREMEKIIGDIMEGTPSLLLHSCCAPCSSSVLERLNRYFKVTLFYFNPNIYPLKEYEKRLAEQLRLAEALKIPVIEGEYDYSAFEKKIAALPNMAEGGERCRICFEMRLEASAGRAEREGMDYFATTITVSPHKNAELVNATGEAAAVGKRIRYLPSDFKKQDGYRRSIELSKEYSLYRQNYCGCKCSIPTASAREVNNLPKY